MMEKEEKEFRRVNRKRDPTGRAGYAKLRKELISFDGGGRGDKKRDMSYLPETAHPFQRSLRRKKEERGKKKKKKKKKPTHQASNDGRGPRSLARARGKRKSLHHST